RMTGIDCCGLSEAVLSTRRVVRIESAVSEHEIRLKILRPKRNCVAENDCGFTIAITSMQRDPETKLRLEILGVDGYRCAQMRFRQHRRRNDPRRAHSRVAGLRTGRADGHHAGRRRSIDEEATWGSVIHNESPREALRCRHGIDSF